MTKNILLAITTTVCIVLIVVVIGLSSKLLSGHIDRAYAYDSAIRIIDKIDTLEGIILDYDDKKAVLGDNVMENHVANLFAVINDEYQNGFYRDCVHPDSGLGKYTRNRLEKLKSKINAKFHISPEELEQRSLESEPPEQLHELQRVFSDDPTAYVNIR